MERKIHKIDAEGKAAGRLASQIAILLRGKHKVDWQPNIDSGDFVEVSNVVKMKFTGNKLENKIYYHHSRHPGGLRETQLKKMFAEKPEFVLWNAVYHMLPSNKLRDKMIKRMKIS
jgi:large subunit ribosomal protein L13